MCRCSEWWQSSRAVLFGPFGIVDAAPGREWESQWNPVSKESKKERKSCCAFDNRPQQASSSSTGVLQPKTHPSSSCIKNTVCPKWPS